MELSCVVQHYDWGKTGEKSRVAIFYKNANKCAQIERDTPYAEMWMGTHPNGPSKLKTTEEPLSQIIEEHPEYLGKNVVQRFGLNLPFLFKVLSIHRPLSIQVHPTKEQAEMLHAQHPELYKDDNHKPEIAIALSHFEALCGFRPLEEIQGFLRDIPELRCVIGGELVGRILRGDRGAIEPAFKQFFCCEQAVMAEQQKQLIDRLLVSDETVRKQLLAVLIERVYFQFPGDCGCFAVYFLNHLRLEPMDAIYIGAGELHSYLCGDCVECMAASDNVVRAGLTNKYKDCATLCKITNFKGSKAEEKLIKPEEDYDNSVIYKPPVPEFAIVKHDIPPSEEIYSFPVRRTGSIILVTHGNGRYKSIELKQGTSLFLPADAPMEVTASERLIIFQAIVNI